MADQPRVQQLLDEIFDSERTPEEVCTDCPDEQKECLALWNEVGSLLNRIQHV